MNITIGEKTSLSKQNLRKLINNLIGIATAYFIAKRQGCAWIMNIVTGG